MNRIIHQIWVGPHRIPARERGYMERIRAMYPEAQHMLWTDSNLPAMTDAVARDFKHWASERVYAFQADVLRAQVVATYGGLYLDIDMEPVKKCPWLWDLTGVFHHNDDSDPTIPNDTIGLERDHALGGLLIDRIHGTAHPCGPHWLGDSLRLGAALPLTAPMSDLVTSWAIRGISILRSSPQQSDYAKTNDHWQHYFAHRALYSWSTENKQRFASGDYE